MSQQHNNNEGYNFKFVIFKKCLEPEMMEQRLRAQLALTSDSDSIPSTYMVVNNTLDSSPR